MLSAFRVTVYESNVRIQRIQNSGEASNTSDDNNPECTNATTAIQVVSMSGWPGMEIHRSLRQIRPLFYQGIDMIHFVHDKLFDF